MDEQLTVSCPRGHGPLAALVPETLDGVRRAVGFCAVCGGMWVPHDLVQSMLPEKVRVDLVWAEVDEPCIECSCGRFPGKMTFRSQQIGDVGSIAATSVCVCGSTVARSKTSVGAELAILPTSRFLSARGS